MDQTEDIPTASHCAFESAASWWYCIQVDATVNRSNAFWEWMKDPKNAFAFQAVQSSMGAFHSLAATPKIVEMRRAALGSVKDIAVKPRRMRGRMLLLAAAGLTIAAAGGIAALINFSDPSYATMTGERRSVALFDGSRMLLDSDTEVSVHYSDGARALTLRRGRARFDVAHDATRPFTVAAGNEAIIAVGTSFDVEDRGAQTLVTVSQGHVLVKDRGADHGNRPCATEATSLVSGDQMVAFRTCAHIVNRVNIDVETAWEKGHLLFRAVPLADAVLQVNRYTDQPITVDASVARLRISGAFNSGDIGAFVNAITRYFPVSAIHDTDGNITLKRSL
jgi:transmembrane sensor